MVHPKDVPSAGMSKLSVALAEEKPRRRSSVMGRVTIGSSLLNSIELSITQQNNSAIAEGDSDGEDSDDVLYKRSNSNTKVQVSDFDKLCVLGQGAYGKVTLVRSKKDNRLFAQKELKKASVIIDEKSVERTISERTILSQITRHPNIVKLFYALHDDYKLYLLMEFIPGGELFQYLAKEKFLSERNASFYITQMAMALKYLHSCGIIYRDLKPENCMLDKDGYLVLTDFGLAKQSTQHSADDEGSDWCRSIIGTPEYCAPEVLSGSDYGFQADWWSLGCVMFDLLTGDPPFTGNSHAAIIKKVLKDKPKYPFQVMPDSKSMMNKLLEKKVGKRFNVDQQWEQFQKLGFFKYYKFQDIENRSVVPPIKPEITKLEDAECFDQEFTDMKFSTLGIDIPNSSSDHAGHDNENAFKGFSFHGEGSYIQNYGV